MIRTVLIDLSGTLHIENLVIPGSIEVLDKLLSTNLIVKFVTNTTKESKNILYNRLTSLGFNVQKEAIFSSLEAVKGILQMRKWKSVLLLSEEAKEDFTNLECSQDEKPDAVVIGLAPNHFNYDSLNTAFRCLHNGAKLIAVHSGKYYQSHDGLSLGPGCFVKGLEYSAQCQAEVIGKPSSAFFSAALSNVSPEEAIMIGDDITDDIQGAQKAGIRGYLVQTGKYRSGDENKISPGPDGLFPSVVEAINSILDEVKNDGSISSRR